MCKHITEFSKKKVHKLLRDSRHSHTRKVAGIKPLYKAGPTLWIISQFLRKGATLERVQSKKSLEQLVQFIQLKQTIQIARITLQHIHFSCIARHGQNASQRPHQINVRFFLASYMVVFHSQEVFEEIGEKERSLIEAAKTLVQSFQLICENIKDHNFKFSRVPFSLTQGFQGELFYYLDCFKTWKEPDEKMKMERLKIGIIGFTRARSSPHPIIPLKLGLCFIPTFEHWLNCLFPGMQKRAGCQ